MGDGQGQAPETLARVRYTVELSRRAEKEVLALPNIMFAKVRDALDRLVETPRPVGVRKLKGRTNDWRIRVGRYRILYAIDDNRHAIAVHRVTDRKDVYRL